MGRKIFISFLGTSNYLKTKYLFPDKETSEPVRFIQEAIIKKICSNWSIDDKIMIFCTKSAESKNWEDNGYENSIGLKQCLQKNFIHPEIVEMVEIPDGFTEKELWSIFDIMVGKIEEEDCIIFDVTHAFRYIPMFSSILFNYTRFMKKTEVISVLYGAFEKLGSPKEVEKMPEEKRITPVLDLTSLIRLEQFTDVVSSMKTYGRIGSIGEALQSYAKMSQHIKTIQKGIEEFDQAILLNKMSTIKSGKWLKKINDAINHVYEIDLPQAMKNILQELQKELKDFKQNECNENIESAIDWATKYDMLPNSYTLGQEYIISLIADKLAERNPFHKENNKCDHKRFRTYISALCSISEKDIEAQNFKGNVKDYKELSLGILSIPMIKEIREPFQKLGKNRNELNHAKPSTTTYSKFKTDLDASYRRCLEILKKW